MKEKIIEIRKERSKILKDIGEGRQTMDYGEKLKLLEEEHKKHLLEEEHEWRLKSRATWLKCGGNNTKLFHKVENGRRCTYSIWEIDVNGEMVYTTEEIKKATVEFYGKLYEKQDPRDITLQMDYMEAFLAMFDQEDLNQLKKRVTIDEIKAILK